MKNCKNCKKNCEYRGVAFKNMTIRCSEGCPLEIHNECKEIATPEFREVFRQLKGRASVVAGVLGIVTQAEVILNAADDVRA
ncbi:MAG: hypothetical protein IJK26_10060 [Clostridia bacterium]|nr:hypothetical protein [Clostridia bacterium]